MNIDTRLGTKGMYITECIDQEHIDEIKMLDQTLNKNEYIQFYESRLHSNFCEGLIDYLNITFRNAILEYFNESNKDISDYLGSNSYRVSSWKLDVALPPHVDSVQYGGFEQARGPRPSVNVLAYLTDDYEDGQIYFPEVDVCITPKAGSIVIFDSDLTHAVHAVKSGNRQTLSSNLYNIHSPDIEEFKAIGYRYLAPDWCDDCNSNPGEKCPDCGYTHNC